MTDALNTASEVLVLQHLSEDGPGYLGDWLNAQGVPWEVRCTEAGDAYPASVAGIKGLAVLGGAWSANDDRPSLRQAETLIREADAQGIPVIGHCLGGQLMARAFGGRVQALAVPEIGWLPIRHDGSALAREWFGEVPEAVVYQWHYDSFVELPPGARLIAGSPACAHQAFALRQHLAMQFHIEITPSKIRDWMAHPGASYPEAARRFPETVQGPGEVDAGVARHLAGSEALARRIYTAWRARWPA
ncbi:MAG: type 1 glutamine amidotransferase [Hydrogenophaga sp.]|nr:type 1 glutamine amidotransferase [Hydrogenophaga sp.]